MKAVVLLGLLSLVSGYDCPLGGVYEEQFSKCYYFLKSLESFSEAADLCEDFDAKPVSINNAFEQSLITGSTQEHFETGDYWIGLKKDSSTGFWRWVNGDNTTYINWMSGFPSNDSSLQCAAASLSTGKWYSSNCDTENHFICQTRIMTTEAPTTVVTLDDSGWIFNGDFDAYYKVITTSYTWDFAEQLCQTRNAHLASIHSKEENEYLDNLLYEYDDDGWPVWIGMRAKNTTSWSYPYEDSYYWVDGTAFNYNHFAYDEPSPRSYCVYMDMDTMEHSDGTWYSYPCDYPRFALCKRYI